MEKKAREILKQIRNEKKELNANNTETGSIYDTKVYSITAITLFFVVSIFFCVLMLSTSIAKHTTWTIILLLVYAVLALIFVCHMHKNSERTKELMETYATGIFSEAITNVASKYGTSPENIVIYVLTYAEPGIYLRCFLFLLNVGMTVLCVLLLPGYQKVSEINLINWLSFVELVVGNMLISWSSSYLERTFEEYWNIKSLAKRLFRKTFDGLKQSDDEADIS